METTTCPVRKMSFDIEIGDTIVNPFIDGQTIVVDSILGYLPSECNGRAFRFGAEDGTGLVLFFGESAFVL